MHAIELTVAMVVGEERYLKMNRASGSLVSKPSPNATVDLQIVTPVTEFDGGAEIREAMVVVGVGGEWALLMRNTEFQWEHRCSVFVSMNLSIYASES